MCSLLIGALIAGPARGRQLESGRKDGGSSGLTDDDELGEEAARRMSRQLALVQSGVALLDEADLQGPVLRLGGGRAGGEQIGETTKPSSNKAD